MIAGNRLSLAAACTRHRSGVAACAEEDDRNVYYPLRPAVASLGGWRLAGTASASRRAHESETELVITRVDTC